MHATIVTLACLLLNCQIVLAATEGVAEASGTKKWQVHHDLSITLIPDASELEGRDRLQIGRSHDGPVELIIAPHAQIRALAMNGKKHPYNVDQGHLKLVPDRDQQSFTLDIHYTGRFDDPIPVRPANTDNPGYGVSGTISAAGTFILSGAGWYPRVVDSREAINLRIDAPQDTVAVTAGQMVSIRHEANRTISRWRIDNSLEGISLSAGPYTVDRRTEDGFTAATYFLADTQHLAARYLEASLRYMKLYSGRFGAYPFDAFAVVENFFPTGYGFPGYTVMGGVVLQLPFIPETSLPHEIVHNWWGNGVLVDYATGNWCEGLTTYTADYLLKEHASADAAMDYRRQALRNYAALVSADTDFPLARFRSRTDPATKAVGYDKSAMVFHMLRQSIGENAFWQALRDLYAQMRFKHASWKTLQQFFETRANRSLEGFFGQWIERPGAPRLHLKNVRRKADGPGYLTTGSLVQETPYFDVALDLVLKSEDDSTRHPIHISGPVAEFAIRSTQRPKQLIADPDYHLFRHLTLEEMPPTVNTLRGSQSVILVISTRMGRSGEAMASYFSQAMGLDPVPVITEADLSPSLMRANDLVFIGLPEKAEYLAMLPAESALTSKAFQLEGQSFRRASDVLFLVARRPGRSKNIVALLHPLSMNPSMRVIAKIPHYGRYSYLAFSDGQNRIKGTWEVTASPMMVNWDTRTTVDQGATP